MVQLVDYGLSFYGLPPFLLLFLGNEQGVRVYARDGGTRGAWWAIAPPPSFSPDRSKHFSSVTIYDLLPPPRSFRPFIITNLPPPSMFQMFRRSFFSVCMYQEGTIEDIAVTGVGEVVFSLPSLLSIQPFPFPSQIYLRSRKKDKVQSLQTWFEILFNSKYSM